MTPGIGILELAGGALIVLGIFAALMVWAVFPLIPFALIGAAYATFRYGVPAVAHAAVVAEEKAVQAVRWVLYRVAVRGPPRSDAGGGGPRRRQGAGLARAAQ